MFSARTCVSVFLSAIVPLSSVAQQSTSTTALSPQRDQQALSILNQAFTAAGGVQALGAIQDFTGSGNVVYFWAGDQVKGSVSVKGRGTTDFRVDANLSSGTRSWTVSSGKGTLRDLDGSLVLIPFQSAVNLGAQTLPQLRIATALNNSALSVQYSGVSDVDGHQVYVIHVQQGQYSPSDPSTLINHLSAMDFFIDAATYQVFLVRDTTHPSDNPSVDFAHEIQYSDYRLTNGCLVPYSTTEKINGQTTWTIQLTTVTFNVGLSDADFQL